MSASSKPTTASGSSASCNTIWDTSTTRPAGWNHSKAPSGQKCYLCLRNNLLPMCPVWTSKGVVGRRGPKWELGGGCGAGSRRGLGRRPSAIVPQLRLRRGQRPAPPPVIEYSVPGFPLPNVFVNGPDLQFRPDGAGSEVAAPLTCHPRNSVSRHAIAQINCFMARYFSPSSRDPLRSGRAINQNVPDDRAPKNAANTKIAVEGASDLPELGVKPMLPTKTGENKTAATTRPIKRPITK